MICSSVSIRRSPSSSAGDALQDVKSTPSRNQDNTKCPVKHQNKQRRLITDKRFISLLFRCFAQIPQHFLYFFPLPHGQDSLRPTCLSAIFVFSGFNNISRSFISSGLSGSSPMVYLHPFSSNTDSNSFTLSAVCTLITAGFAAVPNFAVFLPLKIFSIFSPNRLIGFNLHFQATPYNDRPYYYKRLSCQPILSLRPLARYHQRKRPSQFLMKCCVTPTALIPVHAHGTKK